MKKVIVMVALLGLFIAGCQTTPEGNGPTVDETTPKESNGDETTNKPGQDAKQIVYVLGVNGMD